MDIDTGKCKDTRQAYYKTWVDTNLTEEEEEEEGVAWFYHSLIPDGNISSDGPQTFGPR